MVNWKHNSAIVRLGTLNNKPVRVQRRIFSKISFYSYSKSLMEFRIAPVGVLYNGEECG